MNHATNINITKIGNTPILICIYNVNNKLLFSFFSETAFNVQRVTHHCPSLSFVYLIFNAEDIGQKVSLLYGDNEVTVDPI